MKPEDLKVGSFWTDREYPDYYARIAAVRDGDVIYSYVRTVDEKVIQAPNKLTINVFLKYYKLIYTIEGFEV